MGDEISEDGGGRGGNSHTVDSGGGGSEGWFFSSFLSISFYLGVRGEENTEKDS